MKRKNKLDDLLKKNFSLKNPVSSLSLYLTLIQYKKELQQQTFQRFSNCISELEFESVQSRLKHDLLNPIKLYISDYFNIEFTFLSVDKNILTTKKNIYVTINNHIRCYEYSDFLRITYLQFYNDIIMLDDYNFCFINKYDYQTNKVIQQSFL